MEGKRKIVEQKSYEFINAWKDRRDYLEKPVVLRQALDQYEAWKRAYGTDGDEGYYFWLRTQQDQNDPKLKAQFNKIEEFSKKIENVSQFFSSPHRTDQPSCTRDFSNTGNSFEYRHFLSGSSRSRAII
jgi:hypothetical protein